MLSQYYTRVRNAHEEGKLLAAHTVFFSTEILYAMDIVPMHTEMTTWLTALFLREQAELLTSGAELGLAPEICSPHRSIAYPILTAKLAYLASSFACSQNVYYLLVSVFPTLHVESSFFVFLPEDSH